MMNYSNYWGNMGFGAGMFGAWMGAFLLPIIVWSLVWKGWALWKAARAESKVWFVVLLLVNTAGILDILYIFLFSKSKKVAVKKSSKK